MNREDKRAQRRQERRDEESAGEPIAAVPVGATEAAGETVIGRDRTPPTQFIREVRSELRKVAWPSRKEVINYTVVVLVVTLVLTLFTFGMDYVFREFMLLITD